MTINAGSSAKEKSRPVPLHFYQVKAAWLNLHLKLDFCVAGEELAGKKMRAKNGEAFVAL